ncbi:DUF1674 domain-containing protein [Wenzhouxiangella sp. XN201]|uniref:DUF1674 domain-containing protein n=1 Tax=Wenzhouxiangella sp. XN201 TaxID=2710755 RepID=UPI0013CD503A|nr:DUF1674 domain-containing protein [Wenzhouxiangella sp. XN201]NEZ03906.1 DUF1674 domain-containing protein [Wenzhouxiangella sp. XN201]
MNGYNSTSSGGNPDRAPSAESARPADKTGQERNRAAECGERPSKEFGGRRKGLEPTRYGDWEKDGRCIDF